MTPREQLHAMAVERTLARSTGQWRRGWLALLLGWVGASWRFHVSELRRAHSSRGGW